MTPFKTLQKLQTILGQQLSNWWQRMHSRGNYGVTQNGHSENPRMEKHLRQQNKAAHPMQLQGIQKGISRWAKKKHYM